MLIWTLVFIYLAQIIFNMQNKLSDVSLFILYIKLIALSDFITYLLFPSNNNRNIYILEDTHLGITVITRG